MRIASVARIAGTLAALAPMARLAAQDSTVNVLPSAPIGARGAGLGGASTAMIGYAGSVFTNASGLAPIRVMSLEGSVARLTDTSSYFMGAAAVRLGPVNVGGGLRYLRFDAGSFLNDNLESVLGVVGHVGGISFGLAGDYFATQDTLGGKRGTLTTDASVTVAFFDIAALGFAVQNFGRIPLRGEQLDLPSSIRLGLSLNLIDTYSNGRLLVTLDHVWSEGSSRTIFAFEGGVVFYGVGLVARLGAGRVPATSSFASPAFGGSLVLGRGAIDYAYLKRTGQGPLHLFGFRLTP
jgi:hypothetical protein